MPRVAAPPRAPPTGGDELQFSSGREIGDLVTRRGQISREVDTGCLGWMSNVNLYSDIRSLSSSLPVKLCTSSPIPMNYVAAISLPVECRSLSNAAGFLQVVAVPVTAANTVVQCLIST